MGMILGYSRLEHHGIDIPGWTMTVPESENFTDTLTQSAGYLWRTTDLCNKEIGVNTADNKAYIRIGQNINEFQFVDNTNTGQWGVLWSDTISAGVPNNAGLTLSVGTNYLIETIETTSSTHSKAIIHSTKNMLYYDGSYVLQSELLNNGTSSIYVGDSVITRNIWSVNATASDTANVSYNWQIDGGEATDYSTTIKYKIDVTN